MFPSVSPYMSEDVLVHHLKSQLQLIAKQRGMTLQLSFLVFVFIIQKNRNNC